ncbi:MAG: hypothetical protein M3140_09590 [Actinomycetota bacterium]|nr:hypothetical protein [Actinomycetota bacterium]
MKILVILVVIVVIVWFAYTRLKANNSSIAEELRKLRRGDDGPGSTNRP